MSKKFFFFGSSSGCDPDAVAFLDATGISDAIIEGAICTLVSSYKSAGLWDLRSAIYPIAGGTAFTHKWNLKDARDLDAAYRLSIFGGWVHSGTGMLPNASSGYANTHLLANALPQNSVSLSYYSRTNTDTGFDIGAFNGSGTYLVCKSSNVMYATTNSSSDSQVANLIGTGYFASTRDSSTTVNGYRNAVDLGVIDRASLAPVGFSFYIGALNIAGAAGLWGSKECAFATIGTKLTAAQVAADYAIVQAYQTTLGRQV